MLLAGLVHTLSLQTDASLPAWGSLHGRQLLGQTHHLPLANHGAPQARTYIHARADCVLWAEGQATLAHGVVALTRELLWAKKGVTRGVEEAVGCWGMEEGGENLTLIYHINVNPSYQNGLSFDWPASNL